MAANEERASLWRTPLSTPVRTNENGVQDLFRHSEKLLASAVSICRLKGSVECQTGGIITVCEEIQRLLRLAFSENARIEKELKKQKVNYDEEISLLKERITYLEEEKELLNKQSKEMMSKNIDQEPRRNTSQSVKLNKEALQNPQVVVNKLKITEKILEENVGEKEAKRDAISKENVKPRKENESNTDENMPMETNSEVIDDGSLEISYWESPKASKVKAKAQKLSSKKVGKKAVSSKKKKSDDVTEGFINVKKLQDDAEYIADSDMSSKSRRSSRKSTKDDAEKVESVMESPTEDIRETLSTSIHLNPETGLLEMVEVEEEQVEEDQEKLRKNAKKKDIKKNRKNAKNNKDGSKAKPKTEKESLDEDHNLGQEEKVGEFPGSGPLPVNKEKETAPSKSAKPKTPAKTPEQEEELGDVGFLIDISSMITTFVSSPDTTDLELPLMSARERADARKLAALFDLHISIGNKMDNCSSLNLTKTANSKMPKPGKLDNLLSKLSIAAARVAEKASAKTRTKRKLSSVTDVDGSCNDEGSTWDDSQPKKSLKTLSRPKKARM